MTICCYQWHNSNSKKKTIRKSIQKWNAYETVPNHLNKEIGNTQCYSSRVCVWAREKFRLANGAATQI